MTAASGYTVKIWMVGPRTGRDLDIWRWEIRAPGGLLLKTADWTGSKEGAILDARGAWDRIGEEWAARATAMTFDPAGPWPGDLPSSLLAPGEPQPGVWS